MRLTYSNRLEFFDHVQKDHSYTYDPYYFLFDDVQKLAKQKGIVIRYNHPDSIVYTILGCYNFTVVSISKCICQPKVKHETLLFDTDNLVL